ncbi:MAG: site-2 protease family protein [Chloroflexia bacterium]|nr:site-2 protease family protein [Chloroflexia bacterium]
MFRSIKLGSVHGIDVNVHPTFGLVLILVFLQWGIGSSRGFGPFALGMLLVLLVFGSVLIHELGHCAMAKQYGIRVLDITLWPFGGVARIEQMPAAPGSEFLIALAGPAMNLAITVALLPPIALVWTLFGREALFPGAAFFDSLTLGSVLAYLALTNLFMLAFNLLPAFPVDGGRILRAALTPLAGRARATSIAVVMGIILSIGLIVLGVWIRNPIMPMLGVFVLFAARSESRMEHVQSAMRRLKVGQYALWDMGGISPREPLTFALRGGARDLVVTDRGKVVGMLWRSQLLDGLQGGMAGKTVADAMDRSVYVADIDDSVYDVQRNMSRLNRWAVPVTEDGHYRGIFTADRFVHLHRQIAPGVLGQRTISDEWREAIVETLRVPRRSRRR